MSKIKTNSLQHNSVGAATFTLPTADGSSGQALTTNARGQLAFAKAGLFSSYALICDRKVGNVNGGGFTNGAWRTRDLNFEIADPDGIVTIAANEFTLQAGSYLITWRAPAYKVNRHISRLYDVTNSAAITYGQSCFENANDITTISTGSARVTPSGSTVYSIQHACQTTSGGDGFGVASQFDADGDYNNGSTETYSVYTVVEIYKEA